MPTPVLVSGQSNLLLSPEDGTSLPGAEAGVRLAGLADGSFVAIWREALPGAARRCPARRRRAIPTASTPMAG